EEFKVSVCVAVFCKELCFSVNKIHVSVCLCVETFPRAQNVTWISFNFKTLLTWSPKPTNYSYTVEFSQRGQNRERTPLCIQTSNTECDLTTAVSNLKGKYIAEVQSEPVRGVSSDLTEFPHTASNWFCPFNDTIIGRPEFKIAVNEDQRTITVHVKDIETALLNGQKQRQSIRDIFKDDLQYKVYYRKAKSSGKVGYDCKMCSCILPWFQTLKYNGQCRIIK
uniref:Tissue factor n=1 Tax=Electrophorus electricus TaxID=8005 RepID=A0A4W4FEQ4_ELEEL